MLCSAFIGPMSSRLAFNSMVDQFWRDTFLFVPPSLKITEKPHAFGMVLDSRGECHVHAKVEAEELKYGSTGERSVENRAAFVTTWALRRSRITAICIVHESGELCQTLWMTLSYARNPFRPFA